jgi:RNA polymerase sigma-70 factor (ECF subfamily)
VDPQVEFITLFLKHQGDLRAFIGSLVRDRHARDDTFQDVALTLWRKFATYDCQRSFGGWARGIAANTILQRWEKAGRAPTPFSPEAIQAIVEAYDRTEARASARQDALERCMERLPGKSRRLVEMRYGESLSLNQIAQRVGGTLGGVHKALSRIRTRLHECVERYSAAGELIG